MQRYPKGYTVETDLFEVEDGVFKDHFERVSLEVALTHITRKTKDHDKIIKALRYYHIKNTKYPLKFNLNR